MNFNRIAPYYSRLTKLVFGKIYLFSRSHFLKDVKSGSRILLLGGGDCEEILALDPNDISLVCVDSSETMIRLAKENLKNYSAEFYLGSYLNFKSSEPFDVIVTNYFLDLFENDELDNFTDQLNQWTHDNSKWIITDFQKSRSGLNRMIMAGFIQIMYAFFYLVAGLKTQRLPDIKKEIKASDWKILEESTWYKGLIWSAKLSKA